MPSLAIAAKRNVSSAAAASTDTHRGLAVTHSFDHSGWQCTRLPLLCITASPALPLLFLRSQFVLGSGFSPELSCKYRVVKPCPHLPLLLGAVSPAVPLLVTDTHPQLAATHSYNHSSCKAVPSPAIAARRNASSRPFAMYLQLLKVHCTSQHWLFKAPPSPAIAARRSVSSGAVALRLAAPATAPASRCPGSSSRQQRQAAAAAGELGKKTDVSARHGALHQLAVACFDDVGASITGLHVRACHEHLGDRRLAAAATAPTNRWPGSRQQQQLGAAKAAA
jgi:hypothetical protein